MAQRPKRVLPLQQGIGGDRIELVARELRRLGHLVRARHTERPRIRLTESSRVRRKMKQQAAVGCRLIGPPVTRLLFVHIDAMLPPRGSRDRGPSSRRRPGGISSTAGRAARIRRRGGARCSSPSSPGAPRTAPRRPLVRTLDHRRGIVAERRPIWQPVTGSVDRRRALPPHPAAPQLLQQVVPPQGVRTSRRGDGSGPLGWATLAPSRTRCGSESSTRSRSTRPRQVGQASRWTWIDSPGGPSLATRSNS
jgi:hypothetical protein